MVYYGVVSKGCQRCRQRKVKCDQRKPSCLRCEKSKTKCPGYRDLDQVLFRDESERIIKKFRHADPEQSSENVKYTYDTSEHPSRALQCRKPDVYDSIASRTSISFPLSQSLNELGANFFFTRYTFNEPPFSRDYLLWLTQSYAKGEESHVLRIAIEAVGMAGISNVFNAPGVARKSEEVYCRALAAMQEALEDPVQTLHDSTLLSVILLGLFETVNFRSWERYHSWEAHTKAAITLLELRGREQFLRERGGQLYVQIRSQILLSCMEQQLPVPPALVQTTFDFQNSGIRRQWQHRNVASPASICEITFRVVNLRAAFKNGTIKSPQKIRQMAFEIDQDFEDWKTTVPWTWRYATVDTSNPVDDSSFNQNAHIYPNVWIADVWNNWRTMRMLVNQIMVENELSSSQPDDELVSHSLQLIQELSNDICISVPNFIGTTRVASLIRPLYVVALLEMNDPKTRSFAVQQLRRIDSAMGIRQAGLLADTAYNGLGSIPKETMHILNLRTIPIISSC